MVTVTEEKWAYPFFKTFLEGSYPFSVQRKACKRTAEKLSRQEYPAACLSRCLVQAARGQRKSNAPMYNDF